ncbi:uncharacterized protein J7T54_001389 [Emericellopsis cladophorae]|uniref:Uncharacterized protein n=1 Tax=Emericellopsis cladophorae TaxID=2686198 RepID=A0A9P9XUW1_9HYPO|nr:uncharacterized protein J7T54_001389 [Emericellopsis cladophorae]KAI6777839.1 hypothetical protein J7T54_001389 [Emericellopsis cladophorae]
MFKITPVVLAAFTGIATTAAHLVDFERACEAFPPAAGQVGVTAAGGTTVEWDGNNLGNGQYSFVVAIHDENCRVFDVKEAQPQSPGFHTNFDFAGIHEVDVHYAWIGADRVSVPKVYWDGTEIMRWCGDHMTEMVGINAGYWRTCNFEQDDRIRP